MEIRKCLLDEMNRIVDLVRLNGLDISDREDWSENDYFVAVNNGQIIGCIGLQSVSNSGLVRSVTVDREFRSQGVARKMHSFLKGEARKREVTDLYLLTETARDFFLKLGYQDWDREQVPEFIGQTRQFSESCPKSAVLMKKSLTTMGEIAMGNFEKGWFCAESLLLAAADRYNIPSGNLISLASGFCSGIARTGGLCGAVTGSILALSLVFGRKSPQETMDVLYEKVRNFQDKFRAEYGTLTCSGLLGLDLATPEGQAGFKQELWGLSCREYVARAGDILEAFLY